MSHVITGDLAIETTTTTGTGALTLAGTLAGHQTFAQSGIANNDTVEAIIRAVDGSGVPTGDWERSICTYSTTGPTLTRTTVLQSSNSDAAVSFGSGTKYVYRVATSEHEYLFQGAIDLHSSGIVYPESSIITRDADPTKFDIAAGVGYINDGTGATGTIKRVTWSSFDAQNNIGHGRNHVAITAAGALSISATKQSLTTHVYLGYFFYNSQISFITTIWNLPERAGQYIAKNNEFYRNAIGSIVADGLEVTSPSALTLSIAAGEMWSALTKITTSTQTTFTKIYQNTDYVMSVDSASANNCNVTQWNDKTQLAANALVTMTNGYWKKDVVLINPDGTIYYMIGQSEHITEDLARASSIPGFEVLYSDLNIFLAEIIIQKNDSSISASRIKDIRPVLSRVFYDQNTIDYDNILNKPDHNDLTSAQGGTTGERYHLTSAEYTGTGTGVFVRTDSPSLVTPALGTPSAIVLTNATGTASSLTAGTVVDDAITFAKMQNVSTDILLGRGTAGTGNVEEITIGTNLSLDGTTLNVALSSVPYDFGKALYMMTGMRFF